eukprot:TRINITY_DN101107_c0_g1_i1.p2 TRINITY_DN101107_c0_g1~~TRINITY_DN101107_c0_g1_i1.p2  ORF type:complete len:120 (-),score=3.73 TRINITY_DN101107_c0_g1_i1:35-394(-)
MPHLDGHAAIVVYESVQDVCDIYVPVRPALLVSAGRVRYIEVPVRPALLVVIPGLPCISAEWVWTGTSIYRTRPALTRRAGRTGTYISHTSCTDSYTTMAACPSRWGMSCYGLCRFTFN